MARRFARTLREASLSLLRGWRSSTLALAAIVSAVFVLGAFLMVSRTVDAAIARWSEAAEMSVFLDASDAAAPALVERILREDSSVREVHFVGAEEATRRFSKSFPDLALLVSPLSESPLPPSLEARLARDADLAHVMALADRVGKVPGVADVRLDQQLLVAILNVTRAGRVVGGALSLVLILAAALAIASVVRLSYVARRDEVDILYLLGAPLSAIRGPFVAEGALQGAVGTGLAVALLAVAYTIVQRQYGASLADMSVQFLPASIWAAMLVSGIVIGASAGFAAVRGERHGIID